MPCLPPCDGQTEAAAEAADVVKTALVFGACDMFFHKLDSAIAGGDVNACCCVAVGFGVGVKHSLFVLSEILIVYLAVCR